MCSRNPATGEVVFETAAVSPTEVARTTAQAATAAPKWADVPPPERGAVLHRFAELVDREATALAAQITAEVGKCLSEAAAEVEWTAASARWYADHPPAEERAGSAIVRRRPLGVIAAITPWNVPLITPSWKWLPALAAGNAVVWKPSELATGVAEQAVSLMREAGLPEGCLEVLPGDGSVARKLAAHPQVAGVHFTGSTRAGRALSTAAAERFARCALEMGGVNTAVVFPDADLAGAAVAVSASATSLNGQKCSATRRVLVHHDVAEDFLALLGQEVERLLAGNPASTTTTLGPLITPVAKEHAEAAVAAATRRGGRIAGRTPLDLPGDVLPDSFFAPTVLTDLPSDDPLHLEELFAPVLAVATFSDAEEAWTAADRTDYGLTAAVYARDPVLLAEARQRLTAGVLAINRRSDTVDLEAPFGGRRDSGNGFPEGGAYVYSAVTDVQAVYEG